MADINFSHPEIDPKKVELFGPIEQLGVEPDDLSKREFITAEWTRKTMELLDKQVIDRALEKWGMK